MPINRPALPSTLADRPIVDRGEGASRGGAGDGAQAEKDLVLVEGQSRGIYRVDDLSQQHKNIHRWECRCCKGHKPDVVRTTRLFV